MKNIVLSIYAGILFFFFIKYMSILKTNFEWEFYYKEKVETLIKELK